MTLNYTPLTNLAIQASNIQTFDLGDFSSYSNLSIQVDWSHIDNFNSSIQVVVRNNTNAQWLPIENFSQLLTQTPGSTMFDFIPFINKYIGVQVTKGNSLNGLINVYLSGK